MEKTYDHKESEDEIYKLWETTDAFSAKIDKGKKPYCILLPLPNANDPMHMGHALFTIEDILIRYHRMLGVPTLWLPGGDHAGIETQYVFEKKLAKEGKSRFDFDRNTLYKMISDFANQNKDLNKSQMKRLGFSMDWSRYHYSLEPEILEKVFATFRALHEDGLVYRANRMINYCTKCGTAFSDLETDHKDVDGFLYYLNYGPISIATTRPETIFADSAIGVNPKDKRYKDIKNSRAVIPLIHREIPIITDGVIEIGFGTGALKVTPAHDMKDYEIGQRHNLEIIETIDKNGRMINVPEKYLGMKVNAAREEVVKDLEKEGELIKKEALKHTISVCYKCGTTIEPMLAPQWYVKTKTLAKPAIEAVKAGRTKIFPKKRFEKMYFDWLKNVLDWNISRQIVWGPRIPAWYCLDCNQNILINFIDKNKKKVSGRYEELKDKYSFAEIEKGLQSLSAPVEATYSIKRYKKCKTCGSANILQETDTFDTWFLSGQWPLNTLGYPDLEDFKYFYPTSVLDTLWDILFFWVARMMMLGIYRTHEVPFRVIHLHARVVDKHGQKMSKSRGNVINPLEMVDKYGADALRMALTYGVSPASDVVMSDDKVRAMRNFANKVWNIGRFISYGFEDAKDVPTYSSNLAGLNKDDKAIIKEVDKLTKKVTNYLEKYRFDLAAEEIYQFLWHKFADEYIEKVKERVKRKDQAALSSLRHVYVNCLKLLHPFMPFVTEKIWQTGFNKYDKSKILVKSHWPTSAKV
jgi:valyl-tRNA synthetase